MHYRIKGYHSAKGIVSLALKAATIEQARSQAQSQGIDIISVEQPWFLRMQSDNRRGARFDLLLFSQEVRSLTAAGLSIIEALGTLVRKEAPSRKRDIVADLIRQLKEGKPFSVALRAFPDEFPPLYLALTSASEQTGDIGNALGRFIAYRTRLDDLKKRITAATLYPALLIGVGGLVILFLVFYVVPRFTRIYEDFGNNLPFMSRMLMHWGAFVGSNAIELLSAAIFMLTAVTLWLRQKNMNLVTWIGESRLLRDHVRQYDLSRFYRTAGILQQGGIPLVAALGMAAELLTTQADALQRALTDIRSGMAFSVAMSTHELAPPVALDLLRVGERTGDLGEGPTGAVRR